MATRLEPQDFFGGLPEVKEAKSYRGACHVEVFSGEHGANEPIVVVDPPYDGETYDLLTEGEGTNLYKALVELSELAIPGEDLGENGLGMCYSPDDRAVRLTERFVRNFGLLEWGEHAGCDCVGERGQFGRVVIHHQLVELLERLDSILGQLAAFPESLEPEFADVRAAIAPTLRIEPLLPTVIETVDSDTIKELTDNGPGWLQSSPFDLPFLSLPTTSPALQKGTLLKEKARLESRIAEERASASDDHYVSDRFFWLHFDFHQAHDERIEHFNSVSWILQEAFSLRRAVRLWDALRRHRHGDSTDAIASLWRKNRDGRLTLFDNLAAPLKPRRSILVALSVLELQHLVNKHIAFARPVAGYDFFPEGAPLGKTDFRRSRPKLSLRPQSPLAAAWLQLFDDILTDRASGRICQECRTVFAPTRTDQVFCSTTCSNRFHQREYRLRSAAKAAKGAIK